MYDYKHSVMNVQLFNEYIYNILYIINGLTDKQRMFYLFFTLFMRKTFLSVTGFPSINSRLTVDESNQFLIHAKT